MIGLYLLSLLSLGVGETVTLTLPAAHSGIIATGAADPVYLTAPPRVRLSLICDGVLYVQVLERVEAVNLARLWSEACR